MRKSIDKRSRSQIKTRGELHRYEHWLVDNQVYFITARCRDRIPAFATEQTKAIFWNRFEHYTKEFEFTPWVTSLLDNHYHTLGYLRKGDDLPRMMQRIRGSVAKLVNDLLPERITPF
jgi:REP element-mobilizing transposase RayT